MILLTRIYLKYLKAKITYEHDRRIETYPFARDAIREAVYNAIMPNNDDSNLNVSEKHIVRGRKYARDIRLRLQSAINPNIG